MTEGPLVPATNPGTDPVDNATRFHAARNMREFVEEIRVTHRYADVHWGGGAHQGDGRYRYTLTCDGVAHVVEMPGAPLETVRGDGLDVSQQTRLYVDGSWWLWDFAVRSCRRPEP